MRRRVQITRLLVCWFCMLCVLISMMDTSKIEISTNPDNEYAIENDQDIGSYQSPNGPPPSRSFEPNLEFEAPLLTLLPTNEDNYQNSVDPMSNLDQNEEAHRPLLEEEHSKHNSINYDQSNLESLPNTLDINHLNPISATLPTEVTTGGISKPNFGANLANLLLRMVSRKPYQQNSETSQMECSGICHLPSFAYGLSVVPALVGLNRIRSLTTRSLNLDNILVSPAERARDPLARILFRRN